MQNLWMTGFAACLKHGDRIVQLVEIMVHSGCPCFTGGFNVISGIQRRLHATQEAVAALLTDSIDAWTTRQYDRYQRMLNGIL